jgi:hypothetical protein
MKKIISKITKKKILVAKSDKIKSGWSDGKSDGSSSGQWRRA